MMSITRRLNKQFDEGDETAYFTSFITLEWIVASIYNYDDRFVMWPSAGWPACRESGALASTNYLAYNRRYSVIDITPKHF